MSSISQSAVSESKPVTLRSLGRSVGRVLLYARWALLLGISGCGGAMPQCYADKGITIPKSGLYYTNAATFGEPLVTQGETFTVPVTVEKVDGETVGKVVVVTPTPMGGVTFSPVSRSVTLTADVVDITFDATISPSMASMNYPLSVTRTGAGDDAHRRVDTTMHVQSGLVAATVTPDSVVIAPGQSKDVVVSILPRGETTGNVILTATMGSTNFTISPASFSANLALHSTTPVTQTVTANASATNSDGGPLRIKQGPRVLCDSVFTVNTTGGDPTFSITASTTDVIAPYSGESPAVTFTIRSVNGFTGPVKVTWNVDGSVEPVPNTNNFTYNISPSSPATFSRTFTSQATHTVPIPIVFRVTDVPYTQDKSVTVNVRHP